MVASAKRSCHLHGAIRKHARLPGRMARFEQLEDRTLLSISAPYLTTAVDLAALANVKSSDEQATVATALSEVETTVQEQIAAGGTTNLSDFSTSAVHVDEGGRLQVYVQVEMVDTGVVAALASCGLEVETTNAEMQVVQGWVSSGMLEQLAAVEGVVEIAPPTYAMVESGTVTTAGDTILSADAVRSQFAAYGIDGTGVKIGVISDGVEHCAASQATGDLPATITVDPSFPVSRDEGTAMLEIVYDLAPGAELYFSGPETSADMVDAINWLVGQGCDVIVDDLRYFDQPFFEDGAIANAAAAATDAGVVYVTAAGNYAAQHFQGQYQAYNATELQTFYLMDGTALNLLPFPTTAGSVKGCLQWSDAWNASGNDYDLYLVAYTGSSWQTVASSVDVQSGTQDPFEYISYTNSTYSVMGWAVANVGGASRELELYFFGSGVGFYSDVAYTAEDSVFSQAAVSSVIACGAIDAADSPDYDTVEYFSSQGPSTIYADFPTQTKTMRNSLAGCGIDGVSTQAGALGNFSEPFYGTSAACPHVAAIAALLCQTDPTLTPAEVYAALANNATDLTAYGTGYDNVSGYGLFNALDSVFDVFTPTAPQLDATSDSGMLGDGISSVATPTITGTAPLGAYVHLYADGVEQATVQLGVSESTYSIPLDALADGTFAVTVRFGASAATAEECLSNESAAFTLTIDTVTPTVLDVTSALSNGTYPVGTVIPITVTFSEAVIVTGEPTLGIAVGAGNWADWVPYSDGSGTTQLTFTYTVQAGDTSSDLDYLSSAALALDGATIRDLAANDADLTLPEPGAAGSLGANKNLAIDTECPNVFSVAAMSSNPTAATNVKFQVQFSSPVTGVDATDFVLTTTGAVTGCTVTDVWPANGFAQVFTVTLDTGSGGGTLRVDVGDDGTIVDAAGNPLGGDADGSYTSGQTLTKSDKSVIAADLDGNGIDEVVVDFGSSGAKTGLWALMNNSGWVQLHETSPELIVACETDGDGRAELVADFGAQCLYLLQYDEVGPWWQFLHSTSPQLVVAGDLDADGCDEIVADFGPAYGIYTYEPSTATWDRQLHAVNSYSLVCGDLDGDGHDDVVVDFGARYGIYAWMNNSAWEWIHNTSAKQMIVGDTDADQKDELVVDFGSAHGLYVLDKGEGWTQIHYLSADDMVAGDVNHDGYDEVIIDFGADHGIWEYYGALNQYAFVHSMSCEFLVCGQLNGQNGDELIVDFGSPYGIWAHDDDASWRQLWAEPIPSEDLVVDFGASYGIWMLINSADWERLHKASTESMVEGDVNGDGADDVIIDFGPGYGLWVYSYGKAWTQIHSTSPELVATGDVDGDGADEVVADFGAAYGIWIWDSAAGWNQHINYTSGERLVCGDLDGNGCDDVVVDFGTQYGIYAWMNGEEWEWLNSSGEQLTIADVNGDDRDELIVAFGGDRGLWFYNYGSDWVLANYLSPQCLTAGDVDGDGSAEIVGSFDTGAGGLWIYTVATDTWTRIHTQSCLDVVCGDVDGNGGDDLVINFGPDTGDASLASGVWTWTWYDDGTWPWKQLHAVSPHLMVVADVDRQQPFHAAEVQNLYVNQAPTDIELSSAAVAEFQAVGAMVGTLSATDPNIANSFTYALVSGTGSTDNAKFQISGDQLLTSAVFHYETQSSYSIRVRVTDQDGLSCEKVLTITVTDVYSANTVGAYDPTSSTFYLLCENADGSANYRFTIDMAEEDWKTFVGDWDGDGRTDVGLYDPAASMFYLSTSYSDNAIQYTFGYGVPNAGWTPLVGDWDGDGKMGVGLYDPHNSFFYLTDALETGVAQYTFGYGVPDGGWGPIVGDWDGNGSTGVGLYDPTNSMFYLTNTLEAGYAEHTFGYGVPNAGWTPMVGDWDGDGAAGVGLYDPNGSTFYLTDNLATGTAQYTFGYGVPDAGWTPLVGDWDGNGTTGVGLYDPNGSAFYLTDNLATGTAEYTFRFGESGWTPLVGCWKSAAVPMTSVNSDAAAASTMLDAQAVDQLDLAAVALEELTINAEFDAN
jgi:hypothetical protein